jgi:hypothetical protein
MEIKIAIEYLYVYRQTSKLASGICLKSISKLLERLSCSFFTAGHPPPGHFFLFLDPAKTKEVANFVN